MGWVKSRYESPQRVWPQGKFLIELSKASRMGLGADSSVQIKKLAEYRRDCQDIAGSSGQADKAD